MKKLRVYLESTMFNYYFDTERDGHADTVRMFEAIGSGKYEGYTSQYVIYELQMSGEPKRNAMLALINKYNVFACQFAGGIQEYYDLHADGGAGQ